MVERIKGALVICRSEDKDGNQLVIGQIVNGWDKDKAPTNKDTVAVVPIDVYYEPRTN